jgi:hypothetical protein
VVVHDEPDGDFCEMWSAEDVSVLDEIGMLKPGESED